MRAWPRRQQYSRVRELEFDDARDHAPLLQRRRLVRLLQSARKQTTSLLSGLLMAL